MNDVLGRQTSGGIDAVGFNTTFPPGYMYGYDYPVGTLADIKRADRVYVIPAGAYPVVSAREFKLLLDLFEHDDIMKTALLTLGFEVMRPIELCRLKWRDLRWNAEEQRFTQPRHYVYKPRRITYETRSSWFFKELVKPIESKALSDQYLVTYERYGGFPEDRPTFGRKPVRGLTKDEGPVSGKILPWNNQECLTKRWGKMRSDVRTRLARGTISPEYSFLLEKRLESVSDPNESGAKYRVTPYSLRRFGMTWAYYMRYDRDIVSLSRAYGHESPDTTAGYVMPKEAIGLTDKMISEGISIDEFVFRGAKRQTVISAFLPSQEVRFIPAGQSSIFEFV